MDSGGKYRKSNFFFVDALHLFDLPISFVRIYLVTIYLNKYDPFKIYLQREWLFLVELGMVISHSIFIVLQ